MALDPLSRNDPTPRSAPRPGPASACPEAAPGVVASGDRAELRNVPVPEPQRQQEVLQRARARALDLTDREALAGVADGLPELPGEPASPTPSAHDAPDAHGRQADVDYQGATFQGQAQASEQQDPAQSLPELPGDLPPSPTRQSVVSLGMTLPQGHVGLRQQDVQNASGSESTQGMTFERAGLSAEAQLTQSAALAGGSAHGSRQQLTWTTESGQLTLSNTRHRTDAQREDQSAASVSWGGFQAEASRQAISNTDGQIMRSDHVGIGLTRDGHTVHLERQQDLEPGKKTVRTGLDAATATSHVALAHSESTGEDGAPLDSSSEFTAAMPLADGQVELKGRRDQTLDWLEQEAHVEYRQDDLRLAAGGLHHASTGTDPATDRLDGTIATSLGTAKVQVDLLHKSDPTLFENALHLSVTDGDTHAESTLTRDRSRSEDTATTRLEANLKVGPDPDHLSVAGGVDIGPTRKAHLDLVRTQGTRDVGLHAAWSQENEGSTSLGATWRETQGSTGDWRVTGEVELKARREGASSWQTSASGSVLLASSRDGALYLKVDPQATSGTRAAVGYRGEL